MNGTQSMVSWCISEYKANWRTFSATTKHQHTSSPHHDLDKPTEYKAHHSYTCMHILCHPTFTIGLEISVNGRGLAVCENWPARWGFRTGAEAHVGRWGDLLSQGRELHGTRSHGDIVCFVHWLWQSAWVMVWWGVGTHGYIVLVYVFCGLATHWHHSFVFLKMTNHTYMFTKKRTVVAGMRMPLSSGNYWILIANTLKAEKTLPVMTANQSRKIEQVTQGVFFKTSQHTLHPETEQQ